MLYSSETLTNYEHYLSEAASSLQTLAFQNKIIQIGWVELQK